MSTEVQKKTKAPSTARKLKAALAAEAEARAALASSEAERAKLAEDLKRTTATRDRNAAEREALAAEIEQVHSLLDVLPDAVALKGPPANGYAEWEVKLMTRLAAWLAVRK